MFGGERDAEPVGAEAWGATGPERFTTMSIASRGDATVTAAELAGTGARSATRRAPRLRAPNQTHDIPGATSRAVMGRFSRNRGDRTGAADIDGAAPSGIMSRAVNKESSINRTDDIDGARPSRRTFRTTRHVNPLEPQYQLPTAQERPATPPRFVRDAMGVSDIDGARPPPPASERVTAARTTPLDVSDIDGACPSTVAERDKPAPRDILSSKTVDAPAVQRHFRSSRVTDPQRPRHVMHGRVIEDDDPGGRPRRHVGTAPPREAASLTTRDIEGATPGWRPPHSGAAAIPSARRRQFRDVTSVADVAGAQASTMRRGLVTERVTDPNDRIYAPLDGRPPMPRRDTTAGGEDGAPLNATWLSKASVSGGVPTGQASLRSTRAAEPSAAHVVRVTAANARVAAAEAEADSLRQRVAELEARAHARAEAFRVTHGGALPREAGAEETKAPGAGGRPRSVASGGSARLSRGGRTPGSRGPGSARGSRGGAPPSPEEAMGAGAPVPPLGGMESGRGAPGPESALSSALGSALSSARRPGAPAGATSASMNQYSGMSPPPSRGLPARGSAPGSARSGFAGPADASEPQTRQSSARRSASTKPTAAPRSALGSAGHDAVRSRRAPSSTPRIESTMVYAGATQRGQAAADHAAITSLPDY